MPQGLPAGPPAADPALPGGRPTARRKATCPSTHKRASQKRPLQCGQVSPPGTAPPEPPQHRDQPVAAEPGPARSQRPHERAGRRLYKRIEAVAATIEAEWAEQAGAPRREELRATLSDLRTPRPGQPVRQRP